VLGGGQHAREWISVMVPICIADRLANAHGSDRRVRRILDGVTFFIVPLVNPDGYVHSWEVDRYWRKNRRGGHGVDLNRNYSVAWGQAGSSGDPRSPNYRGEHPFSEPETQAMRSLFESELVAAHVDFHSFSQLILYPWSYKRQAPPDRDAFAAIADRMSSAMYARHGAKYGVRPGAELKVGASGTFTDWTYGERGALAFTVELRPATGPDGFVLPPDQIVPTCEESLSAVLELAEWMMRHAADQAG
jgi:murein tripeptide amidase MpaA